MMLDSSSLRWRLAVGGFEVFFHGDNISLINFPNLILRRNDGYKRGVSFSDAWKSRSDVVEGLTNPRPPNLTGRAEFPD